MTTSNSIEWILRRIKRAPRMAALKQIKDDMGDTFAALNEIKTALMVREKELTK